MSRYEEKQGIEDEDEKVVKREGRPACVHLSFPGHAVSRPLVFLLDSFLSPSGL